MTVGYDRKRLLELRQQPGLLHRRFGDLARPQAVQMPSDPSTADFAEDSPLFIHLSVTGRCHARCRGCINAMITTQLDSCQPRDGMFADTVPERDALGVLHLAAQAEADDVIVCLYGGEPLLAVDKIAELDHVLSTSMQAERIRYMLYTSGDFLQQAVHEQPELMRKIWMYSVSIDGTKSQHTAVRHRCECIID